MTDELVNIAVESGIWVTLFVFLLLYILNDSGKRESKYQQIIHENQSIIKELSKKLQVVNEIQKNVCDIRDELKRR